MLPDAFFMAFVWAAAGAYSFEYMAKEEHLRRYYGFYLMTLGVLMALCFAGSIVTFYMFYEAMTLLTFPLVLHTMKRDAVAAGITGAMVGPGSANVVGGQFAFIKTDGRRIDDMVVLAPAAMKVAFGENPKGNYGPNGNMPATRMAIASLLREELFCARQYFENEKKGGAQPDFHWESYRPVFEGRIPLKAHVHRADDIFTAIRIAEEFGLGLTLDHCTEGHLIPAEIAASGFPAIVGPSLASRSKIEVEGEDFKTAGILDKAGVLVALTTDHPVTRIHQLPLCAALAAKKGMGEEAALRAITINAARICRVSDRLGSLKQGKDADFALFDGSPLRLETRVHATVMNGQIVYRAGRP